MGARARFSLFVVSKRKGCQQLSSVECIRCRFVQRNCSAFKLRAFPPSSPFNLQSFEKVFLSNLGWKNCFDEIVFLAIILEIQIWCIYSQQLWMLSKVNHTRYQQMICWPQIPADQVPKGTKYPDERFTRDNIVFILCHHQIVLGTLKSQGHNGW